MKALKNILLVVFLLFQFSGNAQQLFYSTILHGGCTGGGYSFGYGTSVGGTITDTLKIPTGSTIEKAFLLSCKKKNAPDVTVFLNGTPYTFTYSDIISNKFVDYVGGTCYLDNSNISAINITNDINSSVLIYHLTVPPQPYACPFKGIYKPFYIYIVYRNNALPKVVCNLFINNQNSSAHTVYNLNTFTPMLNTNPIGLAVCGSEFCSPVIQDGSYISINNDTIGLLGGDESNSTFACTGVYGNFAYYNDSLFGLEDDTPDTLMGGTDALASLQPYVNNNDTSVKVIFDYQKGSGYAGSKSNPVDLLMLTYTSPCDTFSTSVSADTAICPGDSVALHASGGTSSGSVPAYQWQPAYGLSCTTCANPIASPDSSVTYTVRIYDNDSCSKVLPVRVLVHNPKPKITITNTTCGDQNGKVVFQANNIASYALGNQNNTTGVFTNLAQGSYPVLLTDSFGCTWQDTVNIASQYSGYWVFFSTQPTDSGRAPLTMHGIGSRTNANEYYWLINGDSIPGSMINYTFDSAGTYQVQLIACHNFPPCCDTVSKSITVLPNTETVVTIPNVFTPNGDGINDVFTVNLKNIQSGKISIFNRWGTAMEQTSMQQATNGNLTLNWNGKTSQGKACSAGAYYYVVSYVTPSGDTKTVKGNVTLLR